MLTSDCLGINEKGHLTIGGVDTVYLAEKYGTPLYVMSEDKIRNIAKSYLESIRKNYSGYGVPIYASKAFCCKEICRIIDSEGLDMDAVSKGEIYTAIKAGVNPKKLHFHGNNKTYDEIFYAVENDVGDIIADSFEDINRVDEIGGKLNKKVNLTLRIKPGIDAHTHEFIRTGQIDSKFGFALENGEAEKAAEMAFKAKNISFKGVHCHIGSQIFDVEPFVLASKVMLSFIKQVKDEYGIEIENLNLGGGFGIKYLDSDPFLEYEIYMESVSKAVHEECKRLGLKIPNIYIEPGRSIIGEAGITLYTVGSVKEIENVRNYISVDGGMGDNPRYALYQAEYTCVIANKMNENPEYTATIAGKYCESGDLIQENVKIVKPVAGDILSVLSTGAYNYSMASNYNRNPRPACVMIKDGTDRVIIKRETFEDLIKNDI